MQNNDDLKDPMSDYETSREIDKLLEESSAYRRKYEKDWKEYEGFYDGRHWENQERRPKVNFIFSIVEYEVPILTDSRPGTDIVAVEEENSDDARVLKEAIDFVYQKNHLDLRLAQGVRQALISTNHYLYVDFDPDLENGDGQIVIKGLPWRHVYLDPSESDLDDMSYVIIKRPVKVDVLKRSFPDKAEDIEPEDVEIDDMQESTMYELEDRYHGPKHSPQIGKFKPTDMAYLVEAWRKDYTLEPIPEEVTMEQAQAELDQVSQGMVPEVTRYQNHAQIISFLQAHQSQVISNAVMRQQQLAVTPIIDPSQIMQAEAMNSDESVIIQLLSDLIEQHAVMQEQNPNGMRPKYPNNMRVTVKVADNILYDGASPVDDGRYPLAPIYCYKIDGQPYSTSEVKNILDPQKVINELFYHEYQGLRLVTNPGWVKDDTSNVDDTSLVNEPGIVVTKKQGTEVSRLAPGQVSPQLGEKQMVLLRTIEQISGVTEVAQGKRPAGISAAAAIQTLQDQSIGRIRLKSRMIEEYTMVRLGELVASRIIKYWTKARILRVYDDNGRIQSMQFDPQRLQDLDYLVRVSPGSTVGLSKEALLNISEKLLQQGVIDPEIFVLINDLPFRNTILSKLQERDQMRQQAEALLQENELLKQQLSQLGGGGPPQLPEGSPPQANPMGN